MGDRTSARRGRAGWAAIAVPAALSLVLGTIGAHREYLWRDEFATRQFVSLPVGDMFRAVRHVDLVLTPYYALMRLLFALGLSGTGLRAPSVIAAAAAVALLARLAHRWWGAGPALATGLVLALNPLFVQLSTDARPYALATLGTVLATTALDSALERSADGRPARWTWIGYGAALAFAGLLQPFAALVVLAHVVLVAGRGGAVYRRFAVAVAAAAVVVAPLVFAAQSQRKQVGWIAAPDLKRSIGTLFNVIDYQRDTAIRPIAVAAVLVILALVAATAVVLGPEARWLPVPRPVRQFAFAAVLITGPWAVLLAFSVVAYPVLTSHYVAVSSPGVALMVGLGIAVLTEHAREQGRRPWTGAALVTGVCLLVVATVGPTTASFVTRRAWQDDFPALAADLRSHLHVGDTVVVLQGFAETGFAAGVAYYTRDARFAADLRHRLPGGRHPVVDVRRVVSVRPLRTEATAAASPDADGYLVSGLGGSRTPQLVRTLAAMACTVEVDQRRTYGTDRVQPLACSR